jgi:hypothetical protein
MSAVKNHLILWQMTIIGKKREWENGMENWRFISYQMASAALNMEIDEAIMSAHCEGKVPSTSVFME